MTTSLHPIRARSGRRTWAVPAAVRPRPVPADRRAAERRPPRVAGRVGMDAARPPRGSLAEQPRPAPGRLAADRGVRGHRRRTGRPRGRTPPRRARVRAGRLRDRARRGRLPARRPARGPGLDRVLDPVVARRGPRRRVSPWRGWPALVAVAASRRRGDIALAAGWHSPPPWVGRPAGTSSWSASSAGSRSWPDARAPTATLRTPPSPQPPPPPPPPPPPHLPRELTALGVEAGHADRPRPARDLAPPLRPAVEVRPDGRPEAMAFMNPPRVASHRCRRRFGVLWVEVAGAAGAEIRRPSGCVGTRNTAGVRMSHPARCRAPASAAHWPPSSPQR